MKTFNELTKKELAELSEMQVEAYIDIELANQKTILFFFKSIGNASTGWVYETVEARDKDWERLQSL